MIFEALTALVGTGYGIKQAADRDRQAYRDSWRADLMYESTKKRARAEETMLQNNLTIGAMDNTANNRDSAVAEYQNRSMQEAQAGMSGVTSGTPFYRIDADAIQNRQRLSEIEDRGRLGLEGQVLNLEATKLDNIARTDIAFQNAQDAAESAAYADSPFAYIMGGLTGALSGAATGNGISTLTKDVFGVTVDEAVGGLGATIKAKAAENSNIASIESAAASVAKQRAGGMYDRTPVLNSGIKVSVMQPTEMIGDPDIFSKRFGSLGLYDSKSISKSLMDMRVKSSLAAMFPATIGQPTLQGLTPMTTGQGNTFGGAWSPLTQGARP